MKNEKKIIDFVASANPNVFLEKHNLNPSLNRLHFEIDEIEPFTIKVPNCKTIKECNNYILKLQDPEIMKLSF